MALGVYTYASKLAQHLTYYRTSTEEEADVMHARPGHVIQSSFR